ncbi:hypothetical protein GW17_00046405 [Ensete ventricosum]|nr:hypothetical protein GW17_00046405 [Ensete ventricosum]
MKRISAGGENDGANNSRSNEANNTTSPPRLHHDSATSGLRRAPDPTSEDPLEVLCQLSVPLNNERCSKADMPDQPSTNAPGPGQQAVGGMVGDLSGTVAMTWPTYDQLAYAGINVP